MNLISDVRRDVGALATDVPSLRKFGLMVGGVFAVIGLLIHFFGTNITLAWVLLTIGSVLVLGGLLIPAHLKGIYLVWMAAAITIGWFVSRFLLIILFYLVVTPISLIARAFGHKFLKLRGEPNEQSAWVPKEPRAPRHYEKMY